jgi:hypothetical protein
MRRRHLSGVLQNRRPIIKCIRANWLLPWLTRNTPVRAVLLLRHPGPVVDSQSRLIEYWDPDARLSRYYLAPQIREAYDSEIGWLESRSLGVIEKLTAVWCIENVEPMLNARAFGYGVVFYEDLKYRYPQAWTELISTLSLDTCPDREMILQPSQQASSRWRSKAVVGSQTGASAWRDRLGAVGRAQMDEVLSVFGVHFYHWESDQPDREQYARWLLERPVGIES